MDVSPKTVVQILVVIIVFIVTHTTKLIH